MIACLQEDATESFKAPDMRSFVVHYINIPHILRTRSYCPLFFNIYDEQKKNIKVFLNERFYLLKVPGKRITKYKRTLAIRLQISYIS